MIERSQQVLLEAIKASLFETTFSYPDDTDWDAVIKEAKAQTVMGLISSIIPIHDESSDQVKAFYMRLLHEQDKLIRLLDKNAIRCVILKGCAAAVYYPKPYLRAMGDVDFLVPRAQFNDAMKLMEANGYVYMHGKDENGNPTRHIAYAKNGIEFELHHHFSSKGFNIDQILENAIDKREYREISGYSIPMLPEIENGLVLLGHMQHHLIEDELGLRQIIDWEMYFHSVLNEEKWKKEFAPIAQERGLLDLAVNVTIMCERHLGLPNSIESIKMNDSNEEETANELLESLLTSGNFGGKNPALSENSGWRIRTVIENMRRKSLYSYFQHNGLETWKLCKKYPKLKPFAFIYGFFRFCVRGTAGIIKTGNVKEQISYVKNKNKLDKDLGIKTKKERK